MANPLCCTTEQRSRSASPELPNARISDAAPAIRPLLPNRVSSHGSRFTSARSEDLNELRQIFDNAADPDSKETSSKKSHRLHFAGPSIHSLHKMKSMHALIKRKFSRDLSREKSITHLKDARAKHVAINQEADTVLKVPIDGPNLQFKITKDDLRKDLLSDKKPEEGGYDSDAEVLDDIARKIGKKTPSKRTSLHSIDWTPSPGSKPPSASTKARNSCDLGTDIYHIANLRAAATPSPARFSPFASSSNLQLDNPKYNDRKLRRSHSATSVEIPAAPSLSPIRLPSISSDDGVIPWSIPIAQSLRLSQFPVPPSHLSSRPSKNSLKLEQITKMGDSKDTKQSSSSIQPSKQKNESFSRCDHLQSKVHVQQSTSIDTPNSEKENNSNEVGAHKDVEEGENNDNPRSSVHLYSMRISHHLRSGSLLSWDALAEPEVPNPRCPFRERTISDMSQVSQLQQLPGRTRHERQTSSSGFASSKVPNRWGRVLNFERRFTHEPDHREDISSIYSSRPQSPPDSLVGSSMNVSAAISRADLAQITAAITKDAHQSSYPSDNEATPKASKCYRIINQEAAAANSARESLLNPVPLARNNSVAHTKKSKFREEFSASPPRKKSIPSTSIMKFLRPRNSVRSQSETNLDGPKCASQNLNGAADHADSNGKRLLSKSMISLKTKQDALRREKDASPMWERALKAYQEERSSMFLTPNKMLATKGSPFRERSDSLGRVSLTSGGSELGDKMSTPTTALRDGDRRRGPFSTGRSALYHAEEGISPGAEVKNVYETQPDSTAIVGAWGRYPSHTRRERTASASHDDNVATRDFALEAAIKFALSTDVDPATGPESPLPPSESKKRKKRVGSGRMAKSHSMTFGKTFLKNYSKIFRSQSTELRRHGRGHRSSVTTGGMLEYPELEILPEVWGRGFVERSGEGNIGNHGGAGARQKQDVRSDGGEGGQSTLRLQNTRVQGERNVTLDGAGEAETEPNHTTVRTGVWSVYYEDCVPSFPRASTDIVASLSLSQNPNLELEEFGISPSFESKRLSATSRMSVTDSSMSLPARLRHGRTQSPFGKMGVLSGRSRGTGRTGTADTDARSMVSVKRSTLDLIQLYREQEFVERETVSSLVRMESQSTGGVV
ncbi:hypothetical protein K469DRAFT_728094 [Zopfia rhizophila CBS 207.26]|uniref:Uncharacterized protein n=1 Tax=Zopfia rhizophila CBS 207.26 TaxID=1314779 RepID=A0A6A6DUI1_9PEZI|nr:hypothetical protein K469DRAFT_728094 [Zopfia rhizophila CBS 207.26]